MTARTNLREAKRTAITLAAAQAILASAGPIAVSLGGLAGLSMLGADKSLATAPVTGYMVGMALGALPAAMLMRVIGRRDGFLVGTVVTALGDNAPAEFRSSAISWVLVGGVFAAIIGPQTAIHTRSLLAPIDFAGSFVAIIGLAAIGALILSTLRLAADTPADTASGDGLARSLGEIVLQPRFLAALICGVGAYSMMSFVMTGAPLAIVSCGYTADDATLGISWHMIAMFAPSLFTGRLIARYGEVRILSLGMALLIGSAVTGMSGIALWQFWTDLILLGVGWNFAFVSATTMVTESYLPSEKNKVQGFHDTILFGTVAFASLMSGRVFVSYGWYTVNVIIFPTAAICLTVLAWLIVKQRKARAAQSV